MSLNLINRVKPVKAAMPDLAAPNPDEVMPEACVSGGCGGPDPHLKAPPPSHGTVSVNGVVIAPEAIAREIQHHPAPDAETAWTEAARALAVRELLLQEANRRGVAAGDGVEEGDRQETDEQIVVRGLLDAVLEPEPAGPDMCRHYYDANIERFRTPELFEASHILIEPEGEDEDAWETAKADADTIADSLGDDPDDFAAAAREFSKCPTAHQSGSLGQIRRGELVPAVQEALERLEEGKTAREPIRSSFGYHVLRLQRRIPGRVLPFDMVADKIADMLDARAWAIAAANYTADLAAGAAIEGVLVDPREIGAT